MIGGMRLAFNRILNASVWQLSIYRFLDNQIVIIYDMKEKRS
jgi:hypothetical protein